MQQIRYTQTERNVKLECEAAVCPAPTRAKIKSTNVEFPYVPYSSFTTVGSFYDRCTRPPLNQTSSSLVQAPKEVNACAVAGPRTPLGNPQRSRATQ